VNFPDSDLSLPILTEKDREDLAFLLSEAVDFVALSFVGSASDIDDARRAVRALAPTHPPRLIAKIERRRALREAEGIVAQADGIMVARGDLGVEIPVEEVPIEQKRLVHLANRRGRVVITATQMLESMVQLASPTRAEASDVANAILDGTDAVMLSAETAVGAYPVQAVSYMHRIAVATEPALSDRSLSLELPDEEPVESVADAIGSAARSIADRLPIAAIVAVTESGHSARVLSRYRPPVPIVAVTPDPHAARSLALSFGVVPILVPRSPSTELMMQRAMDAGVREGLLQTGDLCLIAAGIPFGVRGTTNLLKIQSVGEGFLSTGDPYFAD
jgi:pyruvate kinase